MAGRRPTVTDDEVFAAARRAMRRRGPHELTLADIAEEAGVTPGRLVQRFGSKRALLRTLSQRFAATRPAIVAGARAARRTPLATLRAYAARLADLAPTPEALLRNLAYLQGDLADDVLRGHLVDNAAATRRGIEALLRDAVAAGELRRDTDVRTLARSVETIVSGSLMTWATYREGKAAPWIRRDLEALLSPWLIRAGTARRRPSARR